MNLLLIDAGNTRIKWLHISANGERLSGHLSHQQVDQLATHTGHVSHLVISNVAGAALGNRITQQYPSCKPYNLNANAQLCGVHNHYQPATQLGSDRWAALIGAHHLGALHSIIVSAGTAVTVDALSHGKFLGGIIMPGMRLMYQALTQNTAQLTPPDGHISAFPTNTADAITTGCMLALTSAITTMQAKLKQHDTIPTDIWLHGGDAASFIPLLPQTPHLVDNLVLTGLEVIAHEEYT